MKLAVSTIGVLLIASSTQFGSEAVKVEHRVTNPSKIHSTSLAEDLAAKTLGIKPIPVPQALIEKELADLREPEGPPPPPAEASIEAVCDTLAAAAQANGLPIGFFARLIWQESRFKQRVVSPAGAQGVAQFMPAVAAERGLSNPFDPLAALPQSAAFLKEHVEYFGNLGLAAAAYNGGARRVTDWLARRGRLPDETRNYVKSITGHDPEKWVASKEVAIAVDLPRNAPCEGVADLSRTAEATKVSAELEPPVAKLVENARIAAAKAAEEARQRIAAAAAAKKSKREKLLAKGKGGKTKVVVVRDKAGKTAKVSKVTDRASKKSGKRGHRIAETSARKR